MSKADREVRLISSTWKSLQKFSAQERRRILKYLQDKNEEDLAEDTAAGDTPA